MINNNFLQWFTPPSIEGYADASDLDLITDCIQKEQRYILPIRGGDVLKFIYPNASPTTLIVALLKNGVVIDSNIGSIGGIYGIVQIPEGLPFGYYNLFIYTIAIDYTSDWTTVSSTCELDGEGHNTGYQNNNQERTYTQTATAVALSDCLKLGVHRHTSLVRFRDDYTAFGFDYSGNQDEGLDPFCQLFRLHVEIVFPDYQVEEAVYRQSNGYRRFGNVYIDEKQELRTAAFDQRTHQCMISALKHRFFFVNECQYFAAGAYKIDNVERGLSSTASTDIFTQDFDLRNFGCEPNAPVPPLLIGEYSGNDYSSEDYQSG